jgi:hypothetical protein
MSRSPSLNAGAASVSITPPLGVDLMGFLRRSEPARGYGEPMEANALVLDDGDTRLVLLGLDTAAVVGAWGRRLRELVADACGCPVGHVLVNAQHTHAAPPTPGWAKIGGDAEWHPAEVRYADALPDLVVSAAAAAAGRLQPARAGWDRTSVDGISVNRRQREGAGTILGWNPDEACDRDVAVIRVDRMDGHSIATVVVFACHPVVVGPDVPEISSDFVGPLRSRVRAWTGGDCLFLQGCAGNILPLEAFWDRAGPEHSFGDRLAARALAAWTAAETEPLTAEQIPFRSAVPIAIWRKVGGGRRTDLPLAAAEAQVAVPLQEPPTLEEIRTLRGELERHAAELQAQGAPRTAWNPVLLHSLWARAVEERVVDGSVEREVLAPVQALRIGDACLTAWPCEPFCELGLEVKERSPAPFPITLGYSNDLIGYVPTRREFAFGGYEPSVSQRHFGKPAPYAHEAGEVLVAEALELTRRLFPPDGA